MLDRQIIHNSAMLKPDLAKKPVKPDTKNKKKVKGKTNGLRQRQLHNTDSSTNVS